MCLPSQHCSCIDARPKHLQHCATAVGKFHNRLIRYATVLADQLQALTLVPPAASYCMVCRMLTLRLGNMLWMYEAGVSEDHHEASRWISRMLLRRILQHSQQPHVLSIAVCGIHSEMTCLACADSSELYPLGMMGFLVWDHNSTDIGKWTPYLHLHCHFIATGLARYPTQAAIAPANFRAFDDRSARGGRSAQGLHSTLR